VIPTNLYPSISGTSLVFVILSLGALEQLVIIIIINN